MTGVRDRGRFARALVAGLALATGAAHADRVYQPPDAFVREAFGGPPPAPAVLWLSGAARETARAILGHDYSAMRLRYWGIPGRTVWILETIGKDLPITVGAVVEHERIERMRVLIFRESRGQEVESPAFVAQFDGARLTSDRQLDRRIDGISGATLSVRALTRLARLALALHHLTPYARP